MHNPLWCNKPSCTKFHPCTKNAKGAQPKIYSKDNSTDFCEPCLSFSDMLKAAKKTNASVDREELYKFIEYGKKKGIEVKEEYAVRPKQMFRYK